MTTQEQRWLGRDRPIPNQNTGCAASIFETMLAHAAGPAYPQVVLDAFCFGIRPYKVGDGGFGVCQVFREWADNMENPMWAHQFAEFDWRHHPRALENLLSIFPSLTVPSWDSSTGSRTLFGDRFFRALLRQAQNALGVHKLEKHLFVVVDEPEGDA